MLPYCDNDSTGDDAYIDRGCLSDGDEDDEVTEFAAVDFDEVATRVLRAPPVPQRNPCGLQTARNNELKAVRPTGFDCQGTVGKMIDLYLQSEVLAKKITGFYYKEKNLNNQTTDLNLGDLRKALKHFKLISYGKNPARGKISECSINWLFKGGSGTPGKKSARQLRNGYVHTLNESDRLEMIKNGTFFVNNLKDFVGLQLHGNC